MKTSPQNEIHLGSVRFQTVLIFPPGVFQHSVAPLGIPQLRAFLKSRHYEHVKVVDLGVMDRSGWTLPLQRIYDKHIRYSRFLPFFLSIRFFRRIKNSLARFVVNAESRQGGEHGVSIQSIIHSAHSTPPHHNRYVKYIREIVRRGKPRIIGFSIVYPEQIYHSLSLAKAIKTIDKNIFILMGGPQVTKHIRFFTQHNGLTEWVDGLVAGDGEEPLAQLIDSLEHGNNLKEVPNLYFGDGRGGFKRSTKTFCADAGYFYEPEFHGFYFTILPIRLSTGCPWGRCTFCTYRLFQRRYSQGNLASVINAVGNLQRKYNINQFEIIDDFLPPPLLREFSKALLEHGLRIEWSCFLALVQGFSPSLIQLMKQAGCRRVRIGLESMSERILTMMMKPHNPQQAKEILHLLGYSGIDLDVCCMFGFPTETEGEAVTTLQFLRENRRLFRRITVQPFCLEEGTAVFDEPEKYGVTKIYTGDKSHGARRGFRYDVVSGMSQKESERYAERAREEICRF
jgi:radical SAM superfamily enzyme YgiQ (UPF0313 family)